MEIPQRVGARSRSQVISPRPGLGVDQVAAPARGQGRRLARITSMALWRLQALSAQFLNFVFGEGSVVCKFLECTSGRSRYALEAAAIVERHRGTAW